MTRNCLAGSKGMRNIKGVDEQDLLEIVKKVIKENNDMKGI
jgi:hypothetical protein